MYLLLFVKGRQLNFLYKDYLFVLYCIGHAFHQDSFRDVGEQTFCGFELEAIVISYGLTHATIITTSYGGNVQS